MRHLGEIGVVGAAIDHGVKILVGLVIALRVAALDHSAQLLVHALEQTALGRRHSLGRKPRA